MNVLITGINGFIGRNLAIELLARNYTVFGLGRSDKCCVEGIRQYIQGTVTDKSAVEDAISEAEVVVHLAALTAHSDIIDNKYQTLDVNLQGTKNVLDVFNASKITRKLIYSSTGKVYGDIQYLPIDEKHPLQPLNILGKSKYISERLIDFYQLDEKRSVILRMFNVFGDGQNSNFLLPTILSQLHDNAIGCTNTISLGDIKAKRDYIHIKDVINAFVGAIENEFSTVCEVFNIASGKPRTAEDIVLEISKIVNQRIEIDVKNNLMRNDEAIEEYGNFAKAKTILGWEPQIDLYDWLKLKLIG